MAVTQKLIEAPPRAVFDVLRDGYAYARWVVGTKRIRAVDPGWPEPGTKLHYTSAGLAWWRKHDVTTSRSVDEPRCLELEAHAWPAGSARILLRLADVGGSTHFTIDEHPLRGPAAWIHNPLVDLFIHLRNVESLRRLRRLAEHGVDNSS